METYKKTNYEFMKYHYGHAANILVSKPTESENTRIRGITISDVSIIWFTMYITIFNSLHEAEITIQHDLHQLSISHRSFLGVLHHRYATYSN